MKPPNRPRGLIRRHQPLDRFPFDIIVIGCRLGCDDSYVTLMRALPESEFTEANVTEACRFCPLDLASSVYPANSNVLYNLMSTNVQILPSLRSSSLLMVCQREYFQSTGGDWMFIRRESLFQARMIYCLANR